VRVANLPPYDSAEVRGKALAAEIVRALGELHAERVNVLAHSMGGLDSREAIRLGLGDRIASLTTISTPHGGSRLGDLALDLGQGVEQEGINAFVSFIGANFSSVAKDSHLRAAFESLAVRNAAAFKASHPDDPRVFYQSWAGVAGVAGIIDPKDDDACEHKRFGGKRVSGIMHGFLLPMAAVIGRTPQDTLVTVASAKHGEFRGCMPADHLEQVGDALSDGTHRITGFNRVRFYRLLAFDLAVRGF
jgi:triacylglycerol lipase